MAERKKEPGEDEAGVVSGCAGAGVLLTIMGYCGIHYGFWGAVMGTGLGLAAFIVVAEVIYRIVLSSHSRQSQ